MSFAEKVSALRAVRDELASLGVQRSESAIEYHPRPGGPCLRLRRPLWLVSGATIYRAGFFVDFFVEWAGVPYPPVLGSGLLHCF